MQHATRRNGTGSPIQKGEVCKDHPPDQPTSPKKNGEAAAGGIQPKEELRLNPFSPKSVPSSEREATTHRM